MRWLMIVLLASLAALLIAAAGMAHHIWVQRAQIRFKSPAGTGQGSASAPEPAEKTGKETEFKGH
jgi:hypothetical protein